MSLQVEAAPVVRKSAPPRFGPFFVALSSLFAVFGGVFIYRSTVVLSNGQRYFTLFDDAMITMRYAWNTSHGLGPVFNAGERVEGYTNPLMLLIMSIVTFALDKGAAVLAIQVFGIATVIATAYVTSLLVAEIALDLPPMQQLLARILATVAVLTCYPLIYWSLFGMESGLLTLLMVSAVVCALRYSRERKTHQLIVMAVIMGMGYLTRPDALLPIGLIGLYLLYATLYKQAIRPNITRLLIAALVFAVFFGGQTLFRWLYYGTLVPNTYTVKVSGVPLLDRLQNGFLYVRPFLLETLVLLVIATLAGVRHFSPARLLLLGLIVAQILYQVYVGGDVWNYWRMLLLVFPLAFGLAAVQLVQWAAALAARAKSSDNRRAVFLSVVLTVSLIVITNLRFLPEMTGAQKLYQTKHHTFTLEVAAALQAVTKPNATIGLISAGIIPYYADRYTIDYLGKMDTYIANLPPDLTGSIRWEGLNYVPGHNKFDLNYSIKQKLPDYSQQLDWGNQSVEEWARDYYVGIQYGDLQLWLRKDSDAILWDKLKDYPRIAF